MTYSCHFSIEHILNPCSNVILALLTMIKFDFLPLIIRFFSESRAFAKILSHSYSITSFQIFFSYNYPLLLIPVIFYLNHNGVICILIHINFTVSIVSTDQQRLSIFSTETIVFAVLSPKHFFPCLNSFTIASRPPSTLTVLCCRKNNKQSLPGYCFLH